jgi:hypothetical protein
MSKALTRMNLLVNRDDLRRLKDIYGVRSESEAVRRACELVLFAEAAERLADRTAESDGLADVHDRTTRTSTLPHEWPEDEPLEGIDAEVRGSASAATRPR